MALLLAVLLSMEPFGAVRTVYAENFGEFQDSDPHLEDRVSTGTVGAGKIGEDNAGNESMKEGSTEETDSSEGNSDVEDAGDCVEERAESENTEEDSVEEENIEEDSREEDGTEENNTEEADAVEGNTDTEEIGEDVEEDPEGENAEEGRVEEADAGEGNTDKEEIGEDVEEDLEDENAEEGRVEEADAGEGNTDKEEIGEDVEEDPEGKNTGEESIEDTYCLTREQQEEKALLSKMISDIAETDEGVRYVARQIMTTAASLEEAEMISEAYHASIVSFENGLLVMALEDEETTVYDALQAAASSRTTLPAVWPNYYRYAYWENTEELTGENIFTQEDTATEADLESDTEASEVFVEVLGAYNDPDLASDSSQYQWQHVAVGSPYVWQQRYTGAGVKVAVIDSGVSPHEDLAVRESSDQSGAGSAVDGLGHGTHVAGIIGASAGNGIGGAGIAPDCELYNIRVLLSNGSGTDAMIWQGMNEAVEWDVDIINMSLGGPGYNGLLQDKATEAYEKGIAIFVAAGNDGVSSINYPACLDNVICVAATDTNSARAEFSTYGDWVDLSAPGVNIWSTYKNGGYKAESGTSMACPVAAGEAALLLGSHASLKSAEKGAERVDRLEALMKSNSVKVSGSGMGTGITNLTRAFNLTTVSAKPQEPVVTILPDENRQSAQVTITAQIGMKIYYTTNGKTPSFKNGEPAVSAGTMLYDFDENRRLTVGDSARVTVKAIAVNESGISSAVRTESCALEPYVTDITVFGAGRIRQGKSIQLSAELLPAYAADKKVSWALWKKDGTPVDTDLSRVLGVKISGNGKVTATEDAETGSYVVTVTAQDNGRKQGACEIEIIDKYRVKSVGFSRKNLSLVRPQESSCDLAEVLVAEAAGEDIALSAADFKWTSSNNKIASVDQAGVVTAHKAGKVTIRAVADDSSGRKASCTVTVKQLVETISISCPAIAGDDQEMSALAAGRSAMFKARIMPADSTNKKVVWELYKDGRRVDSGTDAEFARKVGVSISAGGKMTASKNAQSGIYTVRAVARDQSGTVSEQKSVVITDGRINKLSFVNGEDSGITIFRKKAVSTTATEKKIRIKIGTEGVADLNAVKVTNSNPGIAAVDYVREDNYITLTVTATGRAAGKTRIVVSSTDGSGKKLACNVTVKNPVSRIHIASNTITSRAYKVNMCIVRGRSIRLKATLESEYGTPSDRRVAWSIDAPAGSGVKISSSGKVTASSKAESGRTYVVTAKAKDGSGVTASYIVKVVERATYISVRGLDSGSRTINVLPQYPDVDGVQQFSQHRIYSDIAGGYVQASTSNSKIVEVTTAQGYLLLTPRKAGNATITLKATDGSGVKARYRIRVTDEIYDPLFL